MNDEIKYDNITTKEKDIEKKSEVEKLPEDKVAIIDKDLDQPKDGNEQCVDAEQTNPRTGIISRLKNVYQKSRTSRQNPLEPDKLKYLHIIIFFMLLFIVLIGTLLFFETWVLNHRQNIDVWIKLSAVVGVSIAVIGNFTGALIEINPDFGKYKALGATLRFVGSMISFTALYIATVILF